ncbi:MAG: Ig-like domain-containing protein [Clostridia bacterium]|nr:Ig-like domain-containing protein [Clostridia bacterium]
MNDFDMNKTLTISRACALLCLLLCLLALCAPGFAETENEAQHVPAGIAGHTSEETVPKDSRDLDVPAQTAESAGSAQNAPSAGYDDAAPAQEQEDSSSAGEPAERSESDSMQDAPESQANPELQQSGPLPDSADEPAFDAESPKDVPESEDTTPEKPSREELPEDPAPVPENDPSTEPETDSDESEPEPTPDEEPSVRIEKLRVEIARGHSWLFPGQSTVLKARISPDEARGNAVHWRSSDPSLAHVDQNGQVTVPRGASPSDSGSQVDIWAEAADGSFQMNLITLTVLPAARSLSIEGGSLTVSLDSGNKPTALRASVEPAVLGRYPCFDWSSSDPQVVEVVGNGAHSELVWRGAGSASIVVTMLDGTGRKARAGIRVELPADGIVLDAPDTLSSGESAVLVARAIRQDGLTPSDVSVTWSLSGQSGQPVTLNNGILSAGEISQPVMVHATASLASDPAISAEKVVMIIP